MGLPGWGYGSGMRRGVGMRKKASRRSSEENREGPTPLLSSKQVSQLTPARLSLLESMPCLLISVWGQEFRRGYIRFVMKFAKLGSTRFLRRPEVDVDKVHISGGLDVAAIVSTVAVAGQSRQ